MITEKEYIDAIKLVEGYKKENIPKEREELNRLRQSIQHETILEVGDRIKFTIAFATKFNYITPNKWYAISRIKKNNLWDDYYVLDDDMNEKYITTSDIAYIEPLIEKRKRKLNFLK